MKQKILVLIAFLITTPLFAQEKKNVVPSKTFVIQGVINPRVEYRHGYANPLTAKDDMGYETSPTVFTNQRSRLNFTYNKEAVRIKAVVQDVRAWGDNPQMVINDGKYTTLHEAWAELDLSKSFTIKAGRMELAYDDERILGNYDWEMQARSHDIALVKYNGYLQAHVGIAHNFDAENNLYKVNNSYKDMQFLWMHKSFQDFRVSAIALNVGVPEVQYHLNLDENQLFEISEKSIYNQTFGGIIQSNTEKLRFKIGAYIQTGLNPKSWIPQDSLDAAGVTLEDINSSFDGEFVNEAKSGRKIKANMLTFELAYKINDNIEP